MSTAIQGGTTQAAALQSEIQNELMRREKAEQGDNTLAEYITVMIINRKTADQINEELSDLQGIDFDPTLTPWLFSKAEDVVARFNPAPSASRDAVEDMPVDSEPSSARPPRASGNARLFTSAVAPLSSQPSRPLPTGPSTQMAGVKRGFSPVENTNTGGEAYNKRRSLGSGAVPTAPRSHREGGDLDRRRPKRSLLDRMGGPPLNPNASEFGPGRSGFQNNFRQQSQGAPMPMMDPWMMGMMGMQNGFNFGNGNSSGSADPAMMQEMFRQNQATMEQMQAMMFQMAQQMGTAPPVYPSSISAQPPQQLGSYTISGRKAANLINPHLSTSTTTKKLVAPPTAPLSAEICKFGVGCTNKSCIYSHPSPVASVSSGMVLKSEVCANNLKCEDKDCEKSHVSPAQLHGDASGQNRVLCKFGEKCTNPTCPYRHEDPISGEWVPPPASTRKPSSRVQDKADENTDVDMMDDKGHDELDITLDLEGSAAGLARRSDSVLPSEEESKRTRDRLDSALTSQGRSTTTGMKNKPNNAQIKIPCRFGAGCTNPSCRFQHGKACRYGKKCFDPKCTFVHPPDRQLDASSISREGFNNYKGEKTLVDREFIKPGDNVETVLPGGEGRGERETASEIKVEGV